MESVQKVQQRLFVWILLPGTGTGNTATTVRTRTCVEVSLRTTSILLADDDGNTLSGSETKPESITLR
jgi:hypothetical protein